MSAVTKKSSLHAAVLLALASLGSAALADDAPSLTGHIDLVSRYYLRGATSTYGNAYPGLGNAGADAPESDKPALQWGADYAHPSGWYAGYWGSQINYSYKHLGESYDLYAAGQPIPSNFQSDKSIENDFYGGYTGKLGSFGYTIGATYYAYYNGKHADAAETKLGLSYGDFGINAQTLLQDTVWGNKGDTYWTLVYAHPLPYDISFNASLGYYTYTKEGKYLGTHDPLAGASCPAGTAFVVNGCFEGKAPVSSGFRHLILGISQPIGKTGLTWNAQAIIAGVNRYDVRQANKATLGLSYGF